LSAGQSSAGQSSAGHAIDAHDFDRAAHLRDYERQLLGQKNETLIAAPPVTGSHRRPWPKPAAAVSLLVVLAAVALVALHHTSSPAKITPADLAVPYHSPDGYSISPPAGWSARGYPSLSAAFVAPTLDNAVQKPFVDNLNVVVAPTPLTLGSTISQEKQQNPSYLSNYTIVTDQPTTLPNGQTAHLLGGTFDWPNGGELENIQLVLVNAGKEYAVTFTSSAGNFNNNYDLARASLSSFTLK
jgi:hypothetical protein